MTRPITLPILKPSIDILIKQKQDQLIGSIATTK